MLLTILLSLAAQAPEQRMGFISVPGGETIIGAELETTIERIIEKPSESDLYAGETPRQSILVDSFYISPTLITNEMYLEYVKDTGTIPPPLWALIDSELRQKIIAEGVEAEGPRYKFDEAAQAEWWKKHWQDEDQKWEMPSDKALEPVVFISFEQAEAYCEWAGVRMPTETEWVRAARGDSHAEYPFGNEFDRTVVGHLATKPTSFAVKRLPVGFFPGNASPYGILDMAGQVHEFTDTPADKLNGFKSFEVKLKKDRRETTTIYPAPAWDKSRIILKGGSYMNPGINCRIDSRIPFARDSAVSVVGFRIASSAQACRDAIYMASKKLKSRIIGGNPQRILNFSQTMGVEKHSWSNIATIKAARTEPESPIKMPNLPKEYAVLNRYAGIALTPIKDPFASGSHPSISKIEKEAAKDGFLYPIGALSTTVSLENQTINPGTYTIVFFPEQTKTVLEKMGAWIKNTDKSEQLSPEINLSYDISNVAITPKREHVLIVDNEGIALSAIQLNKPVKVTSERNLPHDFNFDPENGKMNINFKVAGARGKAYSFKFSLRPTNNEGKSLADIKFWLKSAYYTS